MDAKTPPTSQNTPGPVSKAIATAETKAAKSGTRITPDGFPGPATIMFITARSDSGPALKHMIDLIHMSKKAGLRVFIACPTNPPFGFEFKKLADKLVIIPSRTFSIATLLHLRERIKKYDVDIVHSHGRTAGIYSRLLGRLTKSAIIHSPHGVPDDGTLVGKFRLYADRFLADFKYEAVFSTTNERLKALDVGILKKHTESYVIENAIDLTKYPVRKHAMTALFKVDPSKPETYNKIKIGAFLRPDSPRGHGAFLKIVKDCAAVGQFTCVGITRAQLSKHGSIPANLEIVGPLVDPTQWLYGIDIFVSTSTAEGQVVGANEAIAAGAICILSKISPHEQFAQQHAAVLFDAKNPSAFTEALHSIVRDRSMRDMLLGNSRYMLERFNDAESFRASFMDLYRSAVKRSAGLIL